MLTGKLAKSVMEAIAKEEGDTPRKRNLIDFLRGWEDEDIQWENLPEENPNIDNETEAYLMGRDEEYSYPIEVENVYEGCVGCADKECELCGLKEAKESMPKKWTR